jgi:hypothetical protein
MIFNKGLKAAGRAGTGAGGAFRGREAIAFAAEKAISAVSCQQDIS